MGADADGAESGVDRGVSAGAGRPVAGDTPPVPDAAAVDAAFRAVREHFAPSGLRRVDGVWTKCESDNPTGSFKVRGALAALTRAGVDGVDRVVAASAGNHGAGVAFAAGRLGMHAVIVVPSDCPAVKLEKMRRLGADVRVSAHRGYDDAEAEARALASADGVPFVSPFLHTDVMAGNGGTLVRELLEQRPDMASLVVPVGGGGLLAGALAELERSAPRVAVVAVQSQACPAFVRSLEEGVVHERWQGDPTVAEGLEGGTGAPGVAMARRYGARAIAVPEPAIADAMRRIWRDENVAVEGSAAVVFAARAIGRLDDLPEPCVHVLTGSNVAPSLLESD